MTAENNKTLSADVRKKYIDKLAEKKAGVGGFVGLVVGFILVGVLKAKGLWVLGLIAGGGVLGFGILNYFYNKKFGQNSDEMIQVLYDELEKKERHDKLLSKIGNVTIVVIIAAVFIFNDGARKKAGEIFTRITSDASCSISSRSIVPKVFFINNDNDAGYAINVAVRNKAKEGDVFLVAELLTSEGDFKRSQKIHLRGGEHRVLQYQFPEPTVNVTNVRYRVTCSPNK